MCCLFGFVDYAGSLSVKQKGRLIRELSIAAEARGTDATGVAYNTSRGLQIYKRPLTAHRLHLRIPAEAHVVMGHTRMTTQGSAKKNYNNHPFSGCVKGKHFALAHNGVLWNDLELRRTKHLPRTKVQTVLSLCSSSSSKSPSAFLPSNAWQNRLRARSLSRCSLNRMISGWSRVIILLPSSTSRKSVSTPMLRPARF